MLFLIFLLVIIIVILAYIYALAEGKIKKPEAAESPLPYYAKKSLLTKSEMQFYNQLLNYIGSNELIFVKVSLSDIFGLKKGLKDEYISHFNKISSKHVDFLICDKTTLEPLYAIELDDRSHLSEKRQARDAFVDKVYSQAGLKLIHVKAKKEYTQEDFMKATKIDYLTGDTQTIIENIN